MSTFKINKNTDFTVMSNYHLRDKNLSLKAKGLLSFMLSLPSNWDYSLKGLVSICKENKDAIRSTLNELKEHDYLVIEPSRGENGCFEYNYLIYEKPQEKPLEIENSPNTDFPYTEEPNTENPPQINTKELNTKDIIDKIDKNSKDAKNNILTLELIQEGYLNEKDNLSLFDNLFKEYLNNGYSYKQLFTVTTYIARKVSERKYKDENGESITDKYKYFKSSLKSNFQKFAQANNNLYDEESLKDFSSDYER